MGLRSPWKFGPDDRPRYYDEERHEFYYPGGGCSMSPSYMPRISDGTDKRKGDPYPSRWLFDPFTGAFLRGFECDYTADELDRGEGMKFHPCANDHGSRYVVLPFEPGVDGFRDGKHHYHWIAGYDPQQRRFRTKREHLVRISDGKNVKKGDPYPEHWMTDPFTGEWLKDAGVE
jgi:hypothetical protein